MAVLVGNAGASPCRTGAPRPMSLAAMRQPNADVYLCSVFTLQEVSVSDISCLSRFAQKDFFAYLSRHGSKTH